MLLKDLAVLAKIGLPLVLVFIDHEIGLPLVTRKMLMHRPVIQIVKQVAGSDLVHAPVLDSAHCVLLSKVAWIVDLDVNTIAGTGICQDPVLPTSYIRDHGGALSELLANLIVGHSTG